MGAESFSGSDTMKVLSDSGTGRALVAIFDEEGYRALAESVSSEISKNNRCIVVQSPSVNDQGWRALFDQFVTLIRGLGVRQSSYICFGAAATLVQNFSLSEPKAVRTLVLVDASSRPHPTRWDRVIDRLEAMLPLGLPLRLASGGFNVRAYLHRFRCPLLVVTTGRASGFQNQDADIVAAAAPTAWRVSMHSSPAQQEGLGQSEEEGKELSEAILSFQDTPAKCPQKNVSLN